MPDANRGPEAPISPRAGAYLLGAVAIACCVRLAMLAAAGGQVTGEHVAWLGLCVLAAAYSAACAVVAGLRDAGSRREVGR